jgi:hypothetical protein
VPDPVWDPSGKARGALASVVSDFGTRALSSPSILDNVLHDLLPDSPKQISLIVAAGGSTVASSLQEHVAQGMDADTAVRLASTQLAEQTPYDAAGCRWVTGEFARALGYQVSDAPIATEAPVAPAATPAVAPPPFAPVVPVVEGAPLRPDQAQTVLPPDVPTPPWESSAPVAAGAGAAPPSSSRKVPILIAVAIVIIGVVVTIGAVGHIGPFKQGPTTAPLNKLLPADTSGCTSKFSTFKALQGISSKLVCNESPINGVVFAYQFDSTADYQASFAAFNKAEGFVPSKASGGCPTKRVDDNGLTTWSSKLYRATAGQQLECFSVSYSGSSGTLQPTYVWTAPTENAVFQAVGGKQTSMKTVDTWWQSHAGPFNK